jgi:hypothetical protein
MRTLLSVILLAAGAGFVPGARAQESTWVTLEGDSRGIAFLNNPGALAYLIQSSQSARVPRPPERLTFAPQNRRLVCPPTYQLGWYAPGKPHPPSALDAEESIPPDAQKVSKYARLPGILGVAAWVLAAIGLAIGIRLTWTAPDAQPDRPFNPYAPPTEPPAENA